MLLHFPKEIDEHYEIFRTVIRPKDLPIRSRSTVH